MLPSTLPLSLSGCFHCYYYHYSQHYQHTGIIIKSMIIAIMIVKAGFFSSLNKFLCCFNAAAWWNTNFTRTKLFSKNNNNSNHHHHHISKCPRILVTIIIIHSSILQIVRKRVSCHIYHQHYDCTIPLVINNVLTIIRAFLPYFKQHYFILLHTTATTTH